METRESQNNLLSRALNGERLTDISIIDHHGHFCLTQGMNLEDEVKMIVEEMDNCGVAKSVVFNIDKFDHVKANDDALRGIAMYPDRFIGYAFVRLDKGTEAAVKELERCKSAGMKGLKLHSGYMHEESFNSEKFNDIWAFCSENDWPVIIHGLPLDLPLKHPKTIFVGAHFIEKVAIEEAVENLISNPNHYWCTSATFCLQGAIEQMVSLGCADKLLFGSDFPLNSMSIRMGSVLSANIADEDKIKILGGNAARLLKIKETGEC